MWRDPAERIDLAGAKGPKGEWRSGEVTRVLEIGAGNGCWAMRTPRIGLETERSEGARDRTAPRRYSVWS